MTYALNVSSVDRCPACADTGWVELAGTVKHHGVVYSRGTAPCKWCEQGKARYARMIELRQRPESNFGSADVIVPDDGRPATRQEASAFIEQMRRNLAGVGRVARNGEEQRVKPPAPIGAEVELPPEPAPTQPSYDDIPF